MSEIWLPIKDFEGLYEVSDYGRVRSLKAPGRGNHCGWILKQAVLKGYCVVHLSKKGKFYNRYVARLVAQAFIPNPENKPTVNHRNGRDKLNNEVANLEWATISENTRHAYATGLMPETRKPLTEEHKRKLSEARKRYWRRRKDI